MKPVCIIILIVSCLSGCRKWTEVPSPLTTINNENVYNNDATAAAVLTGIYTNMENNGGLTNPNFISVSLYAGMSADELTLFPGENVNSYTEFYTNSLGSGDITPDFWSVIYPIIYVTNAAIQGLNSSNGLTPAVKQQALGEATFIRAFSYFYLVGLYGDVPLILTSEYEENTLVTRTSQAQVWQQIISDLQTAKLLLGTQYLDATLENSASERVRPTKWAAGALLARAYLYTGDWAAAESETDSIINNASLFSLSTLNDVFLAENNNEAIWQLQPVQLGFNTLDAQIFVIPSTGPGGNWPVYLSTQLLNSFEQGDQRRTNWVDSVISGGSTYYYAYKYKVDSINAPVTEYEMVLRLGEQYLIRSEAEANGAAGGITAAVADLNAIRARAGLANYSGSMNRDSVLYAIYHERQVELFTEWGHRWFDLKRTGTLNSIMGNPGNVYGAKGGNGTWNPDWALYPIAIGQLQADPKLIQNNGY